MDLNKIIRPRLNPLRGLDGTAVAFLGAGSDDDGDFLASVVGRGLLIPRAFVAALGKLTVELQRETRLLVVPKLCDADDKGRFLVRLIFEEEMAWIDPASGRLLPADEPPAEAVRKVIACARRVAGLEVTDGTDMVVRTPFALRCLAAARGQSLDRARAEAEGIEVPSGALPQRFMTALFAAIDGEPPLSPEERAFEVASLCQALEGEYPRQCEQFRQLAQFHPDDEPRNPLDQHREKVERLLREGRVGWAEDIRGLFAGNGDQAILVQTDTGIPIIAGSHRDSFHMPKTAKPVVAFPMADFVAHLESAEGIVNHMYLDTADDPNVTIGIGTNLTDAGGADAAVRLLQGHATVRATGVDATEQEIRDEYAEIARQQGGNRASWYEQFTTLDIDDARARQLAEDFVRRALAALVAGDDFLEFDRTPANAQKGLMDLLYNLGPDGLVNTFKIFSSSYNGRDWKTASQQVFRDDVSDDRDNIISAWFRDLASGHRHYIFGFVTPGTGIEIDNLD